MTVIEKQYMDSVISINRMMRKAQDAEPDWEQRRYEIALAMFASPYHLSAKEAVMNADELIAELKKTQEKK